LAIETSFHIIANGSRASKTASPSNSTNALNASSYASATLSKAPWQNCTVPIAVPAIKERGSLRTNSRTSSDILDSLEHTSLYSFFISWETPRGFDHCEVSDSWLPCRSTTLSAGLARSRRSTT
jgi:hypothetical protein